MAPENKIILDNMVGIANAYKNSAEVMKIGNILIKLLAFRQRITTPQGRPLDFDCEILPRILLYSLNIEIQFKALYLADADTKSKGHDLEDLFNKLAPTRQQEIIGKMPKPYNIEVDFRKVLHDNKETFIEWRYSYEQKQLECNVSFLHMLSNALAGILLPIVNP